MGSTLKTQNYQLSQFTATDKPSWINDYDSDMRKIDTGIAEAKTTADKAGADSGGALAAAQAAQVAAESAQTAATAANTKANEASTTATTALTQANKGVTDAATAFDHANTAITIATEADNKAVAATTAATNAQNTATAANTTAGQAQTTATNALNVANQANTGPKYITEATAVASSYIDGQFGATIIIGQNMLHFTWCYDFQYGTSIPDVIDGMRTLMSFRVPADVCTIPVNTTRIAVGYITFHNTQGNRASQTLYANVPITNQITLLYDSYSTRNMYAIGSITFKYPITNI